MALLKKRSTLHTKAILDAVIDDESDDEDDEEKPDAQTSRRRMTVDGAEANVILGKGGDEEEDGGKPDYSAYWRDPVVEVGWLHDMQERIDEGNIAIGGVPRPGRLAPASKRATSTGALVEIDCPHRIAMRSVRKNECDLEHTHTETIDAYCLIHAVMAWGAQVPVAGQGPLFGADA